MKRKFFTLLSCLAITAAFIGCSTANETASGSSAAPESAAASTEASTDTKESAKPETANEPVELTMLIDTDVSIAGFDKVKALAEEKIGITINIETRPGGADGDNIVKTRLASGEMADLCAYNSGALLGALNPSEYFIDISNEGFAQKLNETYKKSVTIDGKTFGVPLSSTQAGAVVYNKEIYAKHNLSVPKTWAEFMNNCKVLKDAGETALIGAYADSWTSQVPFLGDNFAVLAAAPSFVTDFEQGKAKYASTPQALRSFEKLADTHEYYNEDYLATTYDDACDMMANGEGAHWIILTQTLTNIYELYGKEAVDKLGIFGVPGDDDATNGLTVWMPTSIYGNKNSDKIDAVKKFMEFYVSTEALDAYTSAVLPDGPYCVDGYKLPDTAYEAVAKDMQAYFDSGKTQVAMEFLTPVKGPNCLAICQELGSGQTKADEAAKKYDDDCYKQAVQLGLNWSN